MKFYRILSFAATVFMTSRLISSEIVLLDDDSDGETGESVFSKAHVSSGSSFVGKDLDLDLSTGIKHERALPTMIGEPVHSSDTYSVMFKNAGVLKVPISGGEAGGLAEIMPPPLVAAIQKDEVSSSSADSVRPQVKTGLISAVVGLPVGAALVFELKKVWDWTQGPSDSPTALDESEGSDSLVVEEFSPWVERCKKLGAQIYLGSDGVSQVDAYDSFYRTARKDPYLLLKDGIFMQKLQGSSRDEFFGILDEYAANYFCTKLCSILRDDQADILQSFLEVAEQSLIEKNLSELDEEQKKTLAELYAKMHSYGAMLNNARA